MLTDPFALYARLRDEDPAHWSPLLKAWVLTRYDDVKRVCLDTAGHVVGPAAAVLRHAARRGGGKRRAS